MILSFIALSPLRQALAQRVAEALDDHDGDKKDDQDHAKAVVFAPADLFIHNEAQSARAHIAEDRGVAHVALQTKQGHGQIGRQHLRKDGGGKGAQARSAQRLHRLVGPHIHRFDDLKELLAHIGKGENGGFLQVAGIEYSINTYLEPAIEIDENGEFVKMTGKYRVFDVKVGGKALDLNKTYTLASHDYMLKNGGDGFVMFKGNKVLQDEVMIDNQVLINYIQNNLKGTVGSEYAQAQGRITITSTNELSTNNQLSFYFRKFLAQIKV